MKNFSIIALTLFTCFIICSTTSTGLSSLRKGKPARCLFEPQPQCYVETHQIAQCDTHFWLMDKKGKIYKEHGLKASIKGTQPKNCKTEMKASCSTGELFCIDDKKVLHKMTQIANNSYMWQVLAKDINNVVIDNNNYCYVQKKDNKLYRLLGKDISKTAIHTFDSKCTKIDCVYETELVCYAVCDAQLIRYAKAGKTKLQPALGVQDVCYEKSLGIIVNSTEGVYFSPPGQSSFSRVCRSIGSSLSCGKGRYCSVGYDDYVYCTQLNLDKLD